MSDRTLVEILETSNNAPGLAFKTEIQRSAAGQPGIFVTNTVVAPGQDDEETQVTVVIDDGLALVAPVLAWLLTDELVDQVAEQNYLRSQYTLDPVTRLHVPWEQCGEGFRQICRNQARLTLTSLVAVGQRRL